MSDTPPTPPSNQPPPQGGWQQPPPQGGSPQPPQPGWQPPPQQGGWQPPPQQGAGKQNSGCLKAALIVFAILVFFGIVAVGCLALAGHEVVKQVNKSMGVAATSDYAVSDLKCETSDSGGLTATGKLKNLSKKAQGFQISVRWETTSGDLITEDSTITDTIDVGQSQLWSTDSFENAPEGTTPTCEVSKVEYTIFDNEGG